MVTAARIYLDSITIAYGEGINMAMEQLDMENMDLDTCLVKESILTKTGLAQTTGRRKGKTVKKKRKNREEEKEKPRRRKGKTVKKKRKNRKEEKEKP